MTDSRADILASIKNGLHKNKNSAQFKGIAVDLPSMHFTQDERVTQFIIKASKAHAVIHQIESTKSIPQLIASTLTDNATLVCAETDFLKSLNWSSTSLDIESDPSLSNEKASINEAFCGISETGTLVMLSHANSPTSLNFLPQIQFVCLKENAILNTYETAWQAIEKQGALPRCINFITGPSCTGDIEQEILWGAHGPKKLHIIIYKEA